MRIPERNTISSGLKKAIPTSVEQPITAEHPPYRWRDVYVDRSELNILLEMWRKVADFEKPEDIEPQLAILIADSGFCKTGIRGHSKICDLQGWAVRLRNYGSSQNTSLVPSTNQHHYMQPVFDR
ncbi:MAG: hypothetical protein AB2715_00610 [Candidatus Thiodiazotropha sp.]